MLVLVPSDVYVCPNWFPTPNLEASRRLFLTDGIEDMVHHRDRYGPSTQPESLPPERIILKPGSKRREIQNVRLGSIDMGLEGLTGAIPSRMSNQRTE